MINIYFFRLSTDVYIQQAKRSIMDHRARRNLNKLNTELQDVQRIMVQNIDDVLQRGAAISGEFYLFFYLLIFIDFLFSNYVTRS